MPAISPGVQAVRDSVGNLQGTVSPDGLLRKVGQRTLRTALVCGDSITGYSEVALAMATVTDNGDGTATGVRSSGHGLSVGQPVRVFGAPTVNMNVMDGVVLSTPDTTTFTFSTGGRTHTVTSASAGNNTSASVVYPWRRSGRGWFTQMEIALKETFNTTWCAVPGAAAADISALLDVTPMTEAADVGFVCIGMNNTYKLGQTFAVAQADIKALIDKVRTKCQLMVVITIPPKSASDPAPGWTSAKQIVHNKLNRWMFDYAKKVGAICVQSSTAVQNGVTYVNPAATYAEATASFLHDTTHSSWRGAIAMGTAVASAIAPYMGTSGWKAGHPSLIGSDTGNILTGCDFPTAVSGIATGWAIDTITGLSVTPSIAARTVAADGDACGNNQLIDIAYGTATGTGTGSPNPRFRKNGIHSLVTAGQTVQLRFPFSITNAVGLIGIEAVLFGTLPNGGSWQVTSSAADSNLKQVPGSFSGVLTTPPAVVPSGLTNLDIWIRPQIDSTQTSALTLKVWQPELLVLS